MQQSASPRGRTYWVDLARCAGILLVVLAHALPTDTWLWVCINQFHMPLFFFLSGFLYRRSGTWLQFVRRKVTSLYLPYVGCSLLTLAVMSALGRATPSLKTAGKILLMLERGPLMGATWFIAVLFFALLIYDGLHRVLARVPHAGAVITVISAAALIPGLYVPLPSRMNNVLLALSFLHLGQLWRRGGFTAGGARAALGAAACFGVVGAVSLVNRSSFSKNQFTCPPLFLAAALAGILGVWLMSLVLSEHRGRVTEHLCWIGRNTVGIVFWQFVSFKPVMAAQALACGLPLDRVSDYPVIYEHQNVFWILCLLLAGVYLSILIHSVLSALVQRICRLIPRQGRA